MLDVGLPLDAADPDTVPLPPVPGFHQPDPSLQGVLISHPHQDHWGLLGRLPAGTPTLIGPAGRRILEAAAFFTGQEVCLDDSIDLCDRRPVELGPFTITPFLMDHSAYDAYALLVEAGGNRLFYTGDLRAHSRKGKLFDRLVANPPRDVDVLLCEGATLGGDSHEHRTEADLQEDLIRSSATCFL